MASEPTSSPIDHVLAQRLTEAQRAAASDPSAEVLAIACAGSGKSRTLAFRIARLIAGGADPRGVVAFTFTEKAAESIKLQVARSLDAVGMDPTIVGAMYVGTIHSYCKDLLAAMDATFRQFEVLDDNRLTLYLISRYPQLGISALKTARNAKYFKALNEIADAWKVANDELLDFDAIADADPDLGAVLREIGAGLERDQFLDFSLMVRLVVEALQREAPAAERAVGDLEHLLVDEYQDVNAGQERLVEELHRRGATLFVAGDDDQAIFGWRGSDVSYILGFDTRYPGCARHTLAHNFRSTEAIVQTADELAAAELGATRLTKDPTADTPDGPRDYRVLWFPEREPEAEWVAARIEALLGTAFAERDGTIRGLTPADFAILMRSTRMEEAGGGPPRHAAFTEALGRARDGQGIPFSLEAAGGIFDRPHVAVLRDTFELLRGESPNREVAKAHFDEHVLPLFPRARFDDFARAMAEWGRLIHSPTSGGPRRRVYPQRLLQDILSAFALPETDLDDGMMHDIGVFSRILQDVESVYMSIDSARRFADILNFLQNTAKHGYDAATDDLLRRPDAVTVATVHKVKGLEYPVVFIVDAEARRFPKNNRRYSGWLPQALLQVPLGRGSYQTTRAEEARLFYTAMTRAERYLYITACASLPEGKQARQPSPFTQRLANPEISDDPNGLPAGRVAHAPHRRIDETIVPTTYSEIRYYLRCPQDFQFRKSFGFSPPITEMFGFGSTIHAAVGKLHEQFASAVPSEDDAEEIARDVFHLKHVPESRDPENRPGAYENGRDSAANILRNYAKDYSEDFAHERQVEVRFEVPVTQAVISGTIDLLLRYDKDENLLEASVVDFKTMEGGPDPADNEALDWTELALQVQLYAKAAREVLGENAKTGAVHLLKDGQRVAVPVDDAAVEAAVANVEWAVNRILAGDFPMRPHPDKCDECDFQAICAQTPQAFQIEEAPPPIHLPEPLEPRLARAFSQAESP